MSSRRQSLRLCVKSYISGDHSAFQCLKELGLISEREPPSRGYVLYKALKCGIDVIDYAKYLDWREFEEFIRNVFIEFGFNVVSNLRLNCGGGAEFDVVAWNRQVVYVVEAKKWKSGAWREVAASHLEKTRRCLSWLLAFAPLVVPLVISTGVSLISNRVPIVSIEKIGDFLTSFNNFKDKVVILY
ncbi:MAG: NERD domain-containing protein [Pyrobaculum sp.]